MKNDWIMQEAGWWTSRIYGGVVKERDGKWHCYPSWVDSEVSYSNHKRAHEAMRWLEENKPKRKKNV